ncbi:MAG: polysaccharide deacetylase family protein [Fimbriimonadaceae bacterium]|nr:polysaccharide deacetylase family protein [Fimbriimonadaceae bacterium]
MLRRFHQWGILLLLAVWGCGRGAAAPNADVVAASPPKPAATARVTERAANTEGSVLILEYHRVRKKEARWDRSTVAFREDLERLYRLGFRPVTLVEMLDGLKTLPPGASPVVFTFDDSDPSQFKMLDDGSVDPECAVGIWAKFAEEHPDFPVRASFYVLPPTPWGQAKWIDAKFEWLKKHGCEIGSHTVTHRSLKTLTDAEVAEELGGAKDFLAGHGVELQTMALPLGISPRNAALLESAPWKGGHVVHRAALLVGAGPAPSPSDPKFNPFRLPRIQAIEGDYGITYWLDKVESGDVQPFVQP